MRSPLLLPALLALLALPLAAQTPTRRPVTIDDIHSFKDVDDPQLSPDGQWVAYTVTVVDTARDERNSDIWMTSWDGGTTLQLTHTPKESESTPRWSPDGRYLAFLSGRGDDEGADQLWLLDRRGGEAAQRTSVKEGIEDYAWAPDASRLVLVMEDGDSVEVKDVQGTLVGSAEEDKKEEKPKPIIIERYYFKEDYTGYVRRKRKHLYLFSLSNDSLTRLTSGDADEFSPSWSPDGTRLAFSSKRVGPDPDRASDWNVYVMPAEAGGVARQVTTFSGPDAEPDGGGPLWSPDGRTIAYLQGGPDSLIYYAGTRLAVVAADGSAPAVLLTGSLDRHVSLPTWSADGRSLYLRIEDDRAAYLGRVPASGGPVEKVVEGRRVVNGVSAGRDGKLAVLVESPERPAEIYAVEGSALRALSHQNDSVMATLQLTRMEEFSAKSKDGTIVNGILMHPLNAVAGQPAPTILVIHGGPVGQFEDDFNFYWQLLAANGYAVVAMNPRGSSGRGEKYSLGIWADWGNRDVQDVLAGVDEAVRRGVADPNHLGVGGWSYGGILTNYVIASDHRFKAAVSGASISDIFAGFGTDMYVREYEKELGPPWKNTATYLKLSYPFLHADRITTPTLFLCGQKDFNVPLLNSEQMYQALRSLGVPTKLVIYPGQYHGISIPSFQRHRWEQYLAWYGTYVR